MTNQENGNWKTNAISLVYYKNLATGKLFLLDLFAFSPTWFCKLALTNKFVKEKNHEHDKHIWLFQRVIYKIFEVISELEVL